MTSLDDRLDLVPKALPAATDPEMTEIRRSQSFDKRLDQKEWNKIKDKHISADEVALKKSISIVAHKLKAKVDRMYGKKPVVA